MNKYLLMSAAAVLGSMTPAVAAVEQKGNSGVQPVYLTGTLSGSAVTFCDAVTISWKGLNDQLLDQETGCGSGYTGVFGVGNGINGTTKGIGQHSDMSDSIAAINNSNSAQVNLDFVTTKTGAPVNGGAFTEYVTLITTSGTVETFAEISGHYHFGNEHKGGHHPALSAPLAKGAKVRAPMVSGQLLKK